MSSEVYPKDFFARYQQIDPDLCFILMPIKPEYDSVKKAIEAVVRRCRLHPVRADDITGGGIIHSDIWDHIQRSVAVVADVTELNPNVFFELGVAATMKDKARVIIIRQRNPSFEYPFDIRPFRCIEYAPDFEGAQKLSEQLEQYLQSIPREDDIVVLLSVRMKDWEERGHTWSLLLQPFDLERLRTIITVRRVSDELMAYAFVSSLQHFYFPKYWTDLNKGNAKAAERIVGLVLGPHVQPALRASYAIQFLDPSVQELALTRIDLSASRATGKMRQLLTSISESIRNRRVDEFIQQEAGKLLPLLDADEVLNHLLHWDVSQ